MSRENDCVKWKVVSVDIISDVCFFFVLFLMCEYVAISELLLCFFSYVQVIRYDVHFRLYATTSLACSKWGDILCCRRTECIILFFFFVGNKHFWHIRMTNKKLAQKRSWMAVSEESGTWKDGKASTYRVVGRVKRNSKQSEDEFKFFEKLVSIFSYITTFIAFSTSITSLSFYIRETILFNASFLQELDTFTNFHGSLQFKFKAIENIIITFKLIKAPNELYEQFWLICGMFYEWCVANVYLCGCG